MKSLENTVKFAQRMIDDNKQLRAKLEAMDRMWRNEWDLPDGMDKQWIYKAIDSSPSEALNTAVKSFSANHPKPKLVPLSPDPDDETNANNIERGLLWEYRNADKRSETRLTPDGIRSALRHDKVCIQVIHLPTHYDSIKAAYEKIEDEDERTQKLTTLEKRRKAALRKGDFIINMRNSMNVYHRYSELGLEAVLLVQEMRAGDIASLWEKLASFLNDGSEDWEDKMYNYYDFQSLEQRSVWLGTDDGGEDSAPDKILHEENEIPFISWAIRTGGSSLDDKPEDRCNPYLNTVYTSKAWQLACMLYTAAVSEVIKYSGGPRVVTKTMTGEGVDIDFDGDQAALNLKQTEDASPFPSVPIDHAVMEMYDRQRAAMDGQTGVRVLNNPNFNSNVAFATINALMKSALDGLQPWRELTEMAFADMFELMLLWIDFSERPILFYGNTKADKGQQYAIKPEHFDPDNIYLSVELSADVPTDRVEQANVSTILYERLGYSLKRIMEQLGEEDPQGVMKERSFEEMVKAEIQNAIQQKQALSQMQLQQLMQAAQQMQQGPPPQQEYQQGPVPEQPAFDIMQGQGTDAGGLSQAQVAPGMTREQVAGADMEGNPLAV